MLITSFIRELWNKKRMIIFWVALGFMIFAILGYLGRNDINNGVTICSQSKITVNAPKAQFYVLNEPIDFYEKNAAMVTSDSVLIEVQSKLKSEKINMSIEKINEMIIVKAGGVIEITASGFNDQLVQKVCNFCAQSAVAYINSYDGQEARLLNQATESFTAVISYTENPSAPGKQIPVITKQARVDVNEGGYIAKEIIKYGILGAVLLLFLSTFVYSIIIIFKEEK